MTTEVTKPLTMIEHLEAAERLIREATHEDLKFSGYAHHIIGYKTQLASVHMQIAEFIAKHGRP